MLFLLAVLLVVSLAEVASDTSSTFMIRHYTSRKYIHPYGGSSPAYNNENMVVRSGHPSYIHFRFEPVEDEWGFIIHVDSGKIMSPYGCYMKPGDFTDIVLYHNNRRPCNYFAFDQVNNHIIHHGGKYFHPYGGWDNPGDGTRVNLHHAVHRAMEWQPVNPNNTNEIVLPYGKAKILGDWELVYSVDDSLISETFSIVAKKGKSREASTTTSFKFVWEVTASAQSWFADMSTSASLSSEITQSSRETWQAEVITTHTFEVVAGQSVAVWQRHYIGEQHHHRAYHRTNQFAHTESSLIKPDHL